MAATSSKRVLSQTALQLTFGMPPAKKGPGFRQISIWSYSSSSSATESTESIDIPEEFDSVEALIFCGFESDSAQTIFQQWEASENSGLPYSKPDSAVFD